MSDLSQILDELATGVMSADPEDLPGLTRLHDHFDLAARAFLPVVPLAAESARGTARLLERIILGEVGDVQQAIAKVTSVVSELQALVQSAGAPRPPAVPYADHADNSG